VLQLTRLSGAIFAINPDLIERAEATPDTVLTLVNGGKYVIRETLDELIAIISDYRADIVSAAQNASAARPTHTQMTSHSHRPSGAHRETPERGTVIALRPEVD
jgi:flagellar protein FlbD